MPIQVVAPDPAWAARFEDEAGRLLDVLDGLVTAVHHIGSTSVPGTFAKPVIDILLEVPSSTALETIAEGMARLGYESLGEFGIPGRRYFRKDDSAGVRTHQVHSYLCHDPHVGRHVAFRDYLIAHQDVAEAYSALKRELADRHPEDMKAYVAGKDSFIKEHEAKAVAWLARPSAEIAGRGPSSA